MAATTIRMRHDRHGSSVASSHIAEFGECASACSTSLRRRRCPHLLQIVEGANLWPEDMDDDVAGVDQYPIAMPHALDLGIRYARLGEVFEHAICDRAHMALRPAGGHDHAVSDRGLDGKIDGDSVLGLHVIQAGQDQVKNLLRGGTLLGDRIGGASSVRPSNCRCWQGSFPFACSNAARSTALLKIGMAAQRFQRGGVPLFPLCGSFASLVVTDATYFPNWP